MALKYEEQKMKLLLWTLAIPTVVGLSAIWRGYALAILWAWFAVPIFLLPELSIPQAIGVLMMISFATHQTIENPNDKRSEEDRLGKAMIRAALEPLFALAIGWVVTLFL